MEKKYILLIQDLLKKSTEEFFKSKFLKYFYIKLRT